MVILSNKKFAVELREILDSLIKSTKIVPVIRHLSFPERVMTKRACSGLPGCQDCVPSPELVAGSWEKSW
jgi:hypothetical protein